MEEQNGDVMESTENDDRRNVEEILKELNMLRTDKITRRRKRR